MTSILERGDLSVFYRPRVQAVGAPVRGVQRFFLVLSVGDRHRRVRIGRKQLPARGQRFWAAVERVGSLDHVLADQLEAESYTTKTRGERYQPPARLIARGEYALVRHGDHTHLSYRVDHLEDPDELPDEVRIPAAGSFVLLFKRPRGRARWSTEGDAAVELDAEDNDLVLVAETGA